jgi:predicted dehydrogenase
MNHVIGVIGAGYWGPNLIRNFSALGTCRVKTVCDADPARRDYVTTHYPAVAATAHVEELLQDDEITAIVVATPVGTHHALASRALAAGKHCFVEKPLAATAAECEELVDIAEHNGLTLMVGHTFVYNAHIRAMKQLIQSGDIGEVMYINTRRLNLGLFQKDINVAWDLAPHDISIILYLLDRDPVSVNCTGRAHLNPDIEDVTTLSIAFDDGCIAFVQSSWIDPKKTREMTIVGTRQMVVFDDTEPLEKIRIYDKRVEVPPHYDTFAEFQYSYHYGDVHIPYLKQVEPLRAECEHFLECIETGTESVSSGREGLRVVRLLEAASRSLAAGGSVINLKPAPAQGTAHAVLADGEHPAGGNGSSNGRGNGDAQTVGRAVGAAEASHHDAGSSSTATGGT